MSEDTNKNKSDSSEHYKNSSDSSKGSSSGYIIREDLEYHDVDLSSNGSGVSGIVSSGSKSVGRYPSVE